MNLSFRGFAFWWFIILGIHLVTCAYNLAYAKLYWGFELTIFSIILEYNEIGLPPRHYHTIAYVYVALAGVHGVCALSMVGGSFWQRQLFFVPRKRKHASSRQAVRKECPAGPGTEVSTHPARVIRFLSAAYHRVASEHGVLGVNGRHFHTILMCREFVEVALQTAQAIRMSKYLPRLLLNRFYVILLTINCCSSLFIHSRWFWKDEARRRFAAIFCDCILNLMTTLGVSLIIMLSYVDEYFSNNFRWDLLNDDKWIAQALNEARVVLVVSWADLAVRAIFSLGLVATTIDMKALLSCSSKRKNQVVDAAVPKLSLVGNLESVGQQNNRPTNVPFIEAIYRINSQLVGRGLRKKRILHRAAHSLFAGWGVVILVLHLHASKQTPLHECIPKVYPMAGVLPSCYTVEFNCHELGFVGTKDKVKAELERFDRSSAVKVRILHCQSLEIPDTFRDFGGVQEIMVYNSTIVDWGDTASLTNTHHPKLQQVSVIRVNMTNGILPLGFQSQNFPVLLRQIFFRETNLETLPDDLDSKWLHGLVIFVEDSNFMTIPPSLIRLQPVYLVLTGNPLTHLPPELFESGVQFLYLGHTHVQELPQNVTPTTLSALDVTNTNISFFPSWIDPLVETTLEISPLVIAGGSIYCSQLNDIVSGVATTFSASFQPHHSSLLMDPSETNWELLRQAVDCSSLLSATQPLLGDIDAMYSLDKTEV